jgi:hypothetical protein
MEEPMALRNLGLMHYEQYNYSKLDAFRSNTITLPVPH